VVVGPRPRTETRSLEADEVSWVAGGPPAAVFEALARIRYRHQEAPARVEVIDGGRMRVTFETGQAAVTPGQAVVLYREEEVLGGGWIREAPGDS